MTAKRKIINDPVHGFITIDHPLLFRIITHPYYQRLRRIHQMAMAYLVYPGAVHTRLHHSLGAYHLMCNAVTELKAKGVTITYEEALAAKAAILLHDIGHGPFSHALEHVLIQDVHHETLSLQIMQAMNQEFDGALDMAIAIFTDQYPKKFLHQLISGQLDVDRLDYLTRDSFFTGVNEGVIGYDRIIKMLVVHEGQLLVEEKGIYSIEKFLVARRLMYWQVYLHKTVLAAEKMLVHILDRARKLVSMGDTAIATGGTLDYFFFTYSGKMDAFALSKFCLLDDADISFAVKKWASHSDKVLSQLCTMLLNRSLLKITISPNPPEPTLVQSLQEKAAQQLGVAFDDAANFVFTGDASNTMYQTKDERINILYRDGSVKDISEVDNALIQQNLSAPVKKFYICSLR
jgi:HD superfamily phosphohydrolase